MAVYWINPHTTTNGSGTYASPWSFSSQLRTTFSSGDEIRIKGVALADLLIATTYTATYTSNYQLTITSGGSLGADFANFNVIYLPDIDAFCKITSISGNELRILTSSMYPWYNTSTGQTNITIRKVDLASYPISTTAGIYVTGNYFTDNLTVSDCWVDENTRVTDGSVKSLVHSSSAGEIQCCLEYTSAPTVSSQNRVYDLPNTHFLQGNGNSAIRFYSLASNVTANICQLCSGSNQSQMDIGSATFGATNVDITFKHLNNCLIASTGYGENISVTANNVSIYSQGAILSTQNKTTIKNLTVTFGPIAFYNYTSIYGLFGGGNTIFNDLTINLNGPLDCYTNSTSQSALYGFGYNFTINYGEDFAIYYNRRASTQTSFQYRARSVTDNAPIFANIPTVNIPDGWDVTIENYNYPVTSKGIPVNTSVLPTICTRSLPEPIIADNGKPYGSPFLVNSLVTHRDGSPPYELLGIYDTKYFLVSPTFPQTPVCTTDDVMYRTNGPSVKVNLNTRSTNWWSSRELSKTIKTIKIPVTAGTTHIVSGYVRTDQSTYVNNDLVMRICQNEIQLGYQNMTTACIDAWEQFSISITPTYTGEATLAMDMYFSAGGKSFWLDDLTVT